MSRAKANTALTSPYVCIYASQVAMCIGANKHKKVSEAVELMWQRVAPASFEAAMKRNTMKTEDELAEDIIRTHAEVRGLVDLTLAATCDSSDQVARQYHSVAKELQAVPLPEEDRKLVEDVLKRNLYTTYGNTHEHRVLAYVRDTLGIKCKEDPTFYKRLQGTCVGPWGSFQWFVGGKIDAISEDRALLLEIKNRVNRLFYRVPFYEAVQVQAYLHLLDIERGVLVECLKTLKPARSEEAPVCKIDGKHGWVHGGGACTNGACTNEAHNEARDEAHNEAHNEARDEAHNEARKTAALDAAVHGAQDMEGTHDADAGDLLAADAGELNVNVIPVRRDRELWQHEIVPKLEGFVDFLARLLDDPGLQDRYLQSKRRSAMVTAHVNNWLKFRRPPRNH